MNEPGLDRVYEAALHALITQRCQRAYAHDMRNGLQGIVGGFEILKRTLQALEPSAAQPATAKLAPQRGIDFMRQAIKNHEQGLEQILGQLVLQEEEPVPTQLGEILHEVHRFLSNDARSREITLRVTADEEVIIAVRANRLRLVLLALTLDSIDLLSASSELEMRVSKQASGVRVDLVASSPDGSAPPTSRAQLDLNVSPLRQGLVVPIAIQLIAAEGGRLQINDGITALDFPL